MTDPRCPVCACELAGAGTRCARCQTPHHADCWRFNRGCGLYACRGHHLEGDLPRLDRAEARARLGALLMTAGLGLVMALHDLLTLTFFAAP